MSKLDEWAENHAQRAKTEEIMHSIRKMWNASGMGKTLLMSGPVYQQIVVGVDLGRDEGTKPSVILPGKSQQQQEQQDGSEGAVKVHHTKPGECAR